MISRSTKIIFVGLLAILMYFQLIHSAFETLGDSNTISAQAFHIFDGKENVMARSAVMQDGFAFQDRNTTATYASSFWISNVLDLNQGRLFLGKDLELRNTLVWENGGIVFGDDRAVKFPCAKSCIIGESVYGEQGVGPLIFKDTHICFNGDVTLSLTVHFEGDCSISGCGNLLDLSPGYTIVLGAGARLCLRDLYVRGLGAIQNQLLFSDNDAQINLSNVDIQLENDISTTIGNIYVDGPSTWYLGQYHWTFEQAATLTVNGVTLWKDSLDFPLSMAGTINVGANEQFFDSLNSGTIKCRVSPGDLIFSPYDIPISPVIDTPHINLDTSLSFSVTGDFLSGPINSKTLLDNMYLAPQRKLQVTVDGLLSGSGHCLDFAQLSEPVLLIDPGVTFSLKDITLRNFNPRHVRYGSSTSRLLFGPGTIIELAGSSSLRALVNGIEQSITWTFITDSTKRGGSIKGFGAKLSLPRDQVASLFVDARATLTLEHITLDGVGNKPFNVRLHHPDSGLVLKGMSLQLDGNYNFTQGHITVLNDVAIRGTHTFSYRSPQISHVCENACLLLDYGVTLSYDAIPEGALGDEAKGKIRLDEQSSVLHLRGATLLSTQTGLLLDNGVLRIEDDCLVQSWARDWPESIVLQESTMSIEVLANAKLELEGLVLTR